MVVLLCDFPYSSEVLLFLFYYNFDILFFTYYNFFIEIITFKHILNISQTVSYFLDRIFLVFPALVFPGQPCFKSSSQESHFYIREVTNKKNRPTVPYHGACYRLHDHTLQCQSSKTLCWS